MMITSRSSARIKRQRSQSGLSLIELLVAIAISSIVILGLVTLINSIGVANRAQDGLARLQENGRFAVQRIAADLRAATSQHCASFDAASSILNGVAGGSAIWVDVPRAPLMRFDAGANAATRMGPVGIIPAPDSPWYFMSTRFMMVGHECDGAACIPATNAPGRGVHRLGAALPAMGTGFGQRARGSDVLTLRYLSGAGVRVINRLQSGPPPVVDFFLENNPAALARAGFTTMGNDPVWVSDCAGSEVFLGNLQAAAVVRMAGANFNNARVAGGLNLLSDARAFHVPTSLRTVTYYLQLREDPRNPGRTMSALMRKDGAALAQELVEGVERFDLLYGINDAQGRTSYLTAAQVDALVPAGGQCIGNNEPGCGWSAVKSVEIYLLTNTVDDVSPRGDDEFRYSWLNDGTANAAGTFENPESLGTLRNGLPAGRMLRREFRTLINLRGYNY